MTIWLKKSVSFWQKKRELNFKSIFKSEESKPEKIATFLAVLEMIKLNRILADYDYEKNDFIIKTVKKNDSK